MTKRSSEAIRLAVEGRGNKRTALRSVYRIHLATFHCEFEVGSGSAAWGTARSGEVHCAPAMINTTALHVQSKAPVAIAAWLTVGTA